MKASAGKVLMLVENSYPQDTRVRNEANLLAAGGYQVSVIASAKKGQPFTEDVAGVHVFRVPRLELFSKTIPENPSLLARIHLKVKAVTGYAVEYFYFTSACLVLGVYVLFKRGFKVIHAHNPPDTLFLAALPFTLIGKKFVFDHHDVCPELYRSRYNVPEGFMTRVLRFVEWCSLKLATVTIATNESYKAIQMERAGKAASSIFVVRNGPSEGKMTIVPPSPELRAKGRTILVYIGSLNPQDGVDYLLRSLDVLLHDLGREDFHCVIMGSGDSLEDLRALSRELRLESHVELTGYISEEKLRANLSAADICVDPDPSSPLNDVSTWIKIMEYMAYGKPIVTYDLKETRFSARDAALYVPPNDERLFAEGIATLMDAPQRRAEMGAFGRRRVESELQWSVVGLPLLDAYRALFSK